MEARTERLKNVARLWNEAAQSGDARVEAIRQAYPDRTPRTIQRWVREARDEGLLPPSKPGSTWLRTPSAMAVAAALGVSYEHLVIALREHADGYLKIGATEERLARKALAPASVPEDLSSTFGAVIRCARTKRGWSQRELASQVSVALGRETTPLTITRTEAGTRPVPLDEVAAFAVVLNLSVDELIKVQASRGEGECASS